MAHLQVGLLRNILIPFAAPFLIVFRASFLTLRSLSHLTIFGNIFQLSNFKILREHTMTEVVFRPNQTGVHPHKDWPIVYRVFD